MAHLQHKDITSKIIGAAFEVHNFLGNGFQEKVYQRALAWELTEAGLGFQREIEQDIFYKDVPKPIAQRRVDFLVENRILIEIKARAVIEPAHIVQTLNYLKVYRLKVGLLINFGAKSIEFKRLVL